LQHKKLADLIKHEMETINFQIRFYKEMSQKKGRKQAYDRV
jgi:hypothetical protein